MNNPPSDKQVAYAKTLLEQREHTEPADLDLSSLDRREVSALIERLSSAPWKPRDKDWLPENTLPARRLALAEALAEQAKAQAAYEEVKASMLTSLAEAREVTEDHGAVMDRLRTATHGVFRAEDALTTRKGDPVVVTKGRKVPKGIEGIVLVVSAGSFGDRAKVRQTSPTVTKSEKVQGIWQVVDYKQGEDFWIALDNLTLQD